MKIIDTTPDPKFLAMLFAGRYEETLKYNHNKEWHSAIYLQEQLWAEKEGLA